MFSDDNYFPEIRDEEDYLILKAGKLKVKINKREPSLSLSTTKIKP